MDSQIIDKKYRLDIQGLRAIAVLSVLFFHLDQTLLPGGFIGVDIFFVISGYLVSGIILRQKEKGTFSFKSFYESRIKRIVPAYYVLIVAILFLGSILTLSPDVSLFRHNVFWSVIFLSNNYLATLDNYFGVSSSENPLLHTWTLSLEMQVYFILPILLYFFHKKKLNIFLPIFLVLLVFYCQYEIVVENNKSEAYFSLLCRLPEFLIGVLINIFRFKENIVFKFKHHLSIIGFFIIILSIFFIGESSLFPGLLAILPCLGTAFLIISENGIINRLLTLKPMVFIGELSYSMYLWHWPILAFYRYYYCTYDIPLSHICLLLLLIVILSYTSFRFVEGYFRKLQLKHFIYRFIPIPLLLVILLFASKPIASTLNPIEEYYSSPQSLIGWSTHGKEYKNDIIRGDLLSNDTLLLLGDSHALGFATFLNELSCEKFAFRSITNDRYPSISNLKLYRYPKLEDTVLVQESSLQYIEDYKRISSMSDEFIPKSKIIFFVKSYETNILPSLPIALELLINKLRQDQHLVIVSDYPVLDKNPIRVNRGIVKDRLKDNDYKIVFPQVPSEIIELIDKHDNVHYLDLSDCVAFCNIPYFNDTIMYYDKSHLNNYGLAKYAKYSENDFLEFIYHIRK